MCFVMPTIFLILTSSGVIFSWRFLETGKRTPQNFRRILYFSDSIQYLETKGEENLAFDNVFDQETSSLDSGLK